MEKHEKILMERFSLAVEDILYNSGGNVMWSLFRFENGGISIYYHDLESDMSMELSSAYDIDSVLKLTRAFDRLWKNKRLNDIGLKKYIFKSDNYDPDDIFLKG